jgi:dihydropteroate synthase
MIARDHDEDDPYARPYRRTLHARDRDLELGVRPLLMGIVNASSDSFSDGGRYGSLDARVALARELTRQGADILDVGGESAATGRAPLDAQQEIDLVVPLIERIVAELGIGDMSPASPLVSVDTYKPAVARAAIAAGASIVNDVSGLRDPDLATVCAETGAALVVMHTRAPPKQRLQDPDLYTDIVTEVMDFMRERIDLALRLGVEREQLIVDPGPDFAKTPAQTIELLSRMGILHQLRLPVLMAVSRKDFIGALVRRPPRERLAGTLAAVAHGMQSDAHIFRVHDVAEVHDFLRVYRHLHGNLEPRRDLALAEEHRHQRPNGPER